MLKDPHLISSKAFVSQMLQSAPTEKGSLFFHSYQFKSVKMKNRQTLYTQYMLLAAFITRFLNEWYDRIEL